MKITNIVLAAAVFGAVAPVAAHADSAPQAQPNTYEVSQSVAYHDLDLTNVQGRARLDARLALAVRNVCGTASSRDLREMARVSSCRRAAANGAASGRELALAATKRRSDVAMMTAATPLTHK